MWNWRLVMVTPPPLPSWTSYVGASKAPQGFMPLLALSRAFQPSHPGNYIRGSNIIFIWVVLWSIQQIKTEGIHMFCSIKWKLVYCFIEVCTFIVSGLVERLSAGDSIGPEENMSRFSQTISWYPTPRTYICTHGKRRYRYRLYAPKFQNVTASNDRKRKLYCIVTVQLSPPFWKLYAGFKPFFGIPQRLIIVCFLSLSARSRF
jgi:hypothetical protein